MIVCMFTVFVFEKDLYFLFQDQVSGYVVIEKEGTKKEAMEDISLIEFLNLGQIKLVDFILVMMT